MPAKGVKSTKTKSNVARPTGKSASLNKKIKFNWKIVVVIGVILIAGLGYLYVRLSKAGGYVWAPKDMVQQKEGLGDLVTKNDGRPAVQSRAVGTPPLNQYLSVWINSSLPTTETYCVNGNATAGTELNVTQHIDNRATTFGPQRVGAGSFRVCWSIPGNTTQSPRKLAFYGSSAPDKPLAFFSIERVAQGSSAGTKTTSSPPTNPTPSPSPAAKQ